MTLVLRSTEKQFVGKGTASTSSTVPKAANLMVRDKHPSEQHSSSTGTDVQC